MTHEVKVVPAVHAVDVNIAAATVETERWVRCGREVHPRTTTLNIKWRRRCRNPNPDFPTNHSKGRPAHREGVALDGEGGANDHIPCNLTRARDPKTPISITRNRESGTSKNKRPRTTRKTVITRSRSSGSNPISTVSSYFRNTPSGGIIISNRNSISRCGN